MALTNDLFTTSDAAKYILTLRYNPKLSCTSESLSWKNFTTNMSSISLDFIEKTIMDNIRSKLNPNIKKISISLSGGVDSALVLALLRKTYPNLNICAFTIKFSDSADETPQAAKIAEKFDASHEIILLENYLSELPKAISIIKQPFWDLHWYYLIKNAKQFSSYMISGDGGDELFGGYTFRYKKFLSLITPNSTSLEKTKAYLQCHERDHVLDQKEIFSSKSNFSWNDVYSIIEPFFANSLPSLSQVFLADYNGKMSHNFSPVNKLINSHFGITGITPILNENLINYATHLHSTEKYNLTDNIGKLPLRKLLDRLGVTTLIGNKKMGFSVNTANLWNSYGKNLCKYYLTDSRLVTDKFINDGWIKKYIDKSDLDVRYVNKFLGLLAYEIWYRIFITKELNPNINFT
ncbi:MAG: asparagine synthase [Cenarchaeum symbiont of Oopsacas minuta]|nr:asparagine synthase [Cenarchaeum symbiont of Oopsacas minuta]